MGIKDSSGSLDILRSLTESGLECNRLVGNDSALAQALREGLCDRVVSGILCVLPEILKAMFEFVPGSAEFEHISELLDAFIDHVNIFPTPWGLKWISENRNITPAIFSQPVSKGRAAESAKMVKWFKSWKTTVIGSVMVK